MGNSDSSQEAEPQRFKLHKAVEQQLLHQTNFSVDELRDWYTHFRHHYPNQLITKAEFIETNSKRHAVKDPHFWGHVFDLFDHNQNEEISFGEWIVVLSFLTKGSVSDKLDLLFQVLDVNMDGSITKDELVYVISLLDKIHPAARPPSEFVDEIFDKWDVNHDGTISKPEFIAGITHYQHLNDSLVRLNHLIGQAMTSDAHCATP